MKDRYYVFGVISVNIQRKGGTENKMTKKSSRRMDLKVKIFLVDKQRITYYTYTLYIKIDINFNQI